MSCFGGKNSPDLYHNCCNANSLCEFNGCIDDLVLEPIYIQKVFDAILFNLQGMKTVQNQVFCPDIPSEHRVKRVIDIRCKRFFNPSNVEDARNLKLDLDTSVSGATFLQKSNGNDIKVVGPDGSFSEKILYADTSDCDDKCMGTPVFGTQTISVTGNVLIYLDLLLCDKCNNEVVFTVCAEVNIANASNPLILTNFFEICMPSTSDGAFYPRFTEFCNSSCEARLATNNFGRDLCIDQEGRVTGNLIIAICISCEKKITLPVQLCVLSSGYVNLTPQVNAVCTTFPSLFPNQIKESDTIKNCGRIATSEDESLCCDDDNPCKRKRHDRCHDDCCYDDCCNDDCCNDDCCHDDPCDDACRPRRRR